MSGPQYSSTIKSPVKSTSSLCSTYNPHLTKNKSLMSSANLVRKRHSLIELPQFERNNVPVMGKNALLARTQRDKQEGVIVHDIVVEKFNNILNYYYTRSVKRRSSRNRDSETMSCYTPNSLWDDEVDCFNFLQSTDDVNAESTFGASTHRASSVSTGYENDFSEYDVSKFLREALGDELNACLVNDWYSC